MRVIGALCIALFGMSPALAQNQSRPAVDPKPAQAAKPKPAPAAQARKPVRAKAAPSAPKAASTSPAAGSPPAVYAAMPEIERMAIQSDLVWTGDYNGMIGGEVGDRVIAAVKTFQKRNGGKETGILNPDERGKLAQAAKPRQDQVGWRVADDRVTGVRLGIPAKLVPQSAPAKAGSRWQSSRGEVQVETFRIATGGTTLPAVFEQQKKEPSGRKIEYNVLRPDFFVISGLQGLKKFYVRAHIKGNDVRGVTILYDQAMEGIMEPVVVAMSNAFIAFPTEQIASGTTGPASKRRVEYGTGIVVNSAGHILTDRQLIDECQVIAIAGLGNADRLTEDKTSDVALLRVYGAPGLVPAALGAEAGQGSDVTLVGIADPQAQGGGSAVSTVKARIRAASGLLRPIEPAPALGFSGAAAFDNEARFLGMVGLKPQVVAGPAASQAVIVPAEAVRTFLSAQGIAPRSGTASIDEAKASVVRVICVRK